MIHLLTREVSRLAGKIERELNRIERDDRLLSGVINGVIAGTAVGIVGWIVSTHQSGDLLLFACLGSSAASVVFAPLSRGNSLRTIVIAYGVCCVVCLLLLALHQHAPAALPLQCFLAISLSVFLMRLFDAMHPAAVGTAMAFIIYDRDARHLVMLMLAIIGLLTIVKILAYIYLKDLTFRTFGREFRRDYYGREMTLTVLNEPTSRRLHVGDAPDHANGKIIDTEDFGRTAADAPAGPARDD